MGVIELRKKIIELVMVADEDHLRQFEAFLRLEQDGPSGLTDTQKVELDKRRERHLSGESSSYSLEEVKQKLIDKYGLPA